MNTKPSNKKKQDASKYKEKKETETIDILVFNDLADRSYLLKKNCMIMFSHDKFLNETPRALSLENKMALKNTLQMLQFHGTIYNNFTKRELTEKIKIFAQTDFSEFGYVCVAILTHGHDKPGFIRSYNRWYHESEIFKHFDVAKNPFLRGKPIIFIIQASRGADAMSTGEGGSRRDSKACGDLAIKTDYHLPLDATRIVFHNAYTEGACVRRSCLMHSLCEKINSCSSNYDLIKLFRMARDSAEWVQDSMEWKQMLSYTSTLTRHIYLRNKKVDDPSSLDDEDVHNVENDSILYSPVPNSQDSNDSWASESMAQPSPSLANTVALEETPAGLLPPTYELEKFHKNAMIIFNNKIFKNSDFGVRVGTDHDERALRRTFKRFRFDVTTWNDLDKEALLTEMQKFGRQDFTHYGCISVAILTHGNDRGILLAADSNYREREVFACFNSHTNRSLVGKPIIFLIQACRGSRLARTVQLNQLEKSSSNIELDADKKKPNGYCLPTEADMIIFHSCFSGRASVRESDKGSWFMQTICEQLKKYASTEHLEDIFRRVRVDVAVDKMYENGKQMPVTSSTLLRKLYFHLRP